LKFDFVIVDGKSHADVQGSFFDPLYKCTFTMDEKQCENLAEKVFINIY